MLLSVCAVCNARRAETLTSPDGNLQLTFTLTAEGIPHYSLKHTDTEVVLDSRLGYEFRSDVYGNVPEHYMHEKYGTEDMHSGFSLSDVSRVTFDQTWEPVWGEESHIRNHYNELAVTLRKNNTKGKEIKMLLRFRQLI